MSDFTGIITNISAVLPVQVEHYGPGIYLLVFLSILAASSFIIAPFPGNSLLFVSGALATTHQLDIAWLFIISAAAAYIGYDINYWSGRLLGIAVCKRGCPRIFLEKNVKQSLDLMKRYGNVSIIVSRFIPAVNLPPFFAGMEPMNYHLYIIVNLVGAVVWSGLVLSVGYLFGGIPIVQVILPGLFLVVIVILAISLALAAAMLLKVYGSRRTNTE
ncbi:MAG TPA: VTT domain-containing protein [Methanoregulaceae archaeon]|nr:VTT domain-containing protein [Methanoregulaceae archaeon]